MLDWLLPMAFSLMFQLLNTFIKNAGSREQYRAVMKKLYMSIQMNFPEFMVQENFIALKNDIIFPSIADLINESERTGGVVDPTYKAAMLARDNQSPTDDEIETSGAFGKSPVPTPADSASFDPRKQPATKTE